MEKTSSADFSVKRRESQHRDSTLGAWLRVSRRRVLTKRTIPRTDSRIRKRNPRRGRHRFNLEQEETNSGSMTENSSIRFQFSWFRIVLVGLISGIIVGLYTTPNYTAEGFFAGLAGGMLITSGVLLYINEERPSGP